MTAEAKAEEAPVVTEVVEAEKKVVEEAKVVEVAAKEVEEATKGDGEKKDEAGGDCSPDQPPAVQKIGSFREESNFFSDLKEHERKALAELRAKIEEAILENRLLVKEEEKAVDKAEEKAAEVTKEGEENVNVAEENPNGDGEDQKPKIVEEENAKNVEEEKPKEEERTEIVAKKEEEKVDPSVEEKPVECKKEAEPVECTEKLAKEEEEEKSVDPSVEEKPVECEKEAEADVVAAVENAVKSDEKTEKSDLGATSVEIDEDISIWGVPLLPRKGSEGTDVILMKFLRAREFKVNEAFQMLQNTLLWRKKFGIDSIMDEEFSADLNSVAYMDGVDREGHPVCYNVYGVFGNEELYQKTFGTKEKREQFLRWRFQVMEKGIQKLDFRPGGVASLIQINDLKNLPGPSKKELRLATKEAVGLLQDNYPELAVRNIFINVPFWYYAFNALLSPFFTQRSKSKFVFARPSKVTETLLKYIPAENIPIQYGGLKRDNDTEFLDENSGILEIHVKGGTSGTIEIPAPEVGTTLLWDLTVLGGEVNYKEEFVPSDDGSYTIIVQKAKKLGAHDAPIRNSFKNNEAGKLVFTIDNNSYKKKKVLYRYKVKKSISA